LSRFFEKNTSHIVLNFSFSSQLITTNCSPSFDAANASLLLSKEKVTFQIVSYLTISLLFFTSTFFQSFSPIKTKCFQSGEKK